MRGKIVFLGTAGDPIVVGKQYLSSGGLIIQSQDNQLHIDPGPGSLNCAKEFNVQIRNNIAVLVSHAHNGHCNDVNAVINAMTHGGLDRFGVLVSNRTVQDGFSGSYPFITDFHKSCVEKSIVLEPGGKVGINNFEVIATRTNHSDPSGIGFKITAPGFSIAYTSDTGFSEDLWNGYAGSDILILNTVYHEDLKDPNNLSIFDAIRIIKSAKPRLAVLTHFGIKMMNSDPINLARVVQKESGVQTICAKDGLAINPISHDINQRINAERVL